MSSQIDAKFQEGLILYKQGLGAKSVSKMLWNGSAACAVAFIRKLKAVGAFESGRKSPVWLGLTQAKQCAAATYAKQMKAAFLADHQEWRRGVKHYENAVWREPKWKIQMRGVWVDPNKRIRFYLRKRLRHAAKGGKRYSLEIQEIIGCTPQQLREHLEAKLIPGWTWENHGTVWHIDHEIPCRAFDLTDPEQAKKCFHYSNLRPMGARENIRKSDLLPDGTRARNAA